MTLSGSHTVGLADGGPGLPLLGWSTIGGDLRIPHFVGLHGLQVLLVIGWLVQTYGGKLAMRQRVAIVWTAALSYLELMGVLTWQALRGQSIIAPDGLTFVALGILLGVTLVAIAVSLTRLRGERRSARSARARCCLMRHVASMWYDR